jgi:hypothetical protein
LDTSRGKTIYTASLREMLEKSFALAHGLRLNAMAQLFTSAPFGRMEQYLASGPSLF